MPPLGITPELKISLTNELTETNWDFIYDENSLDAKVEKFQDHVLSLSDKHFPIKNIHVPMGKPVITSPLIRKLKRAKYRAHCKNNPAWKALSAILKFPQQKELQKKTDNEINSEVYDVLVVSVIVSLSCHRHIR